MTNLLNACLSTFKIITRLTSSFKMLNNTLDPVVLLNFMFESPN